MNKVDTHEVEVVESTGGIVDEHSSLSLETDHFGFYQSNW